jgi:hypothetical protein
MAISETWDDKLRRMHYLMFAYVLDSILMSGGDGDGVIVVRDRDALGRIDAHMQDWYASKGSRCPGGRHDDDSCCYCVDEQGCLWIYTKEAWDRPGDRQLLDTEVQVFSWW